MSYLRLPIWTYILERLNFFAIDFERSEKTFHGIVSWSKLDVPATEKPPSDQTTWKRKKSSNTAPVSVDGIQGDWAFAAHRQDEGAASLPDAHFRSRPDYGQVAFLVFCQSAEKDEEDFRRNCLSSTDT